MSNRHKIVRRDNENVFICSLFFEMYPAFTCYYICMKKFLQNILYVGNFFLPLHGICR